MDPAYARYEAAFERRDAPFAFVDLDAMWSNADEMLERAGGKPIRVATKSVRCRALLEAIARRSDRFRGLMTFTLEESLWLYEPDMLLAYPTADREALGRMTENGPVLMVDSVEQLDVIESATKAPVRLCIEVDLSYPLLRGRVKVGVKRSPIRTPDEAARLAWEIEKRPRMRLVGVMGYEAHIAGVGGPAPGEPPMGGGGRGVARPAPRGGPRRGAAGKAAQGGGAGASAARARGRDRRAARRRRGRPAATRIRERRRHGLAAHDLERGCGHGDHGGVGVLRPDALRSLLGVRAHSGRDVRAAGGPQAVEACGDRPGRRLPRERPRGRSPAPVAIPAPRA